MVTSVPVKSDSERKERLVKNTLLLYIRMLFTMGLGLYTSRVVLKNLGIEDFGIYNVVGGTVALLSTVTGSLSTAIMRFITFVLGTGDEKKLNNVFSTSVSIQFVFAFFSIIAIESLGIWFLNNKMSIPVEKLQSAEWVLHFSAVTFAINLISIPYNASIVAHERMSAFAYISIFEALVKVGIALSLFLFSEKRIVYYAMLMALLSVVVRFVYGIYCRTHFAECKYKLLFDKKIVVEMFSFAGWNMIGASSAVLRDQGGNVIMNIFCGPTVNAARGIAIQVNQAVMQFVNNFMTALNPQITKAYAGKDYEYMMSLIFQGAKLSFFILMIVAFPIILNCEYILGLWLHETPSYTVLFVRLILFFAMSESISNPLITAMLATGRIKKYQIVVGGLQMMNLPISYLLLRSSGRPEIVFCIAIVVSQCCLFARLCLLKKMIRLDVCEYLKTVYFKVILVAVVSFIVPFILCLRIDDSTIKFVLTTIVSISVSFSTVLVIGCTAQERKKIVGALKKIKGKLLNVCG